MTQKNARFPINLVFQDADEKYLLDAKKALYAEHQKVREEKFLNVETVEKDDSLVDVTLYKVIVKDELETSFPWEGALVRNFDDENWIGEIVEINVVDRVLHILATSNKKKYAPESSGMASLVVRSFQFLRPLVDLYWGDDFEEIRNYLPGRLMMTLGDVPSPRVIESSSYSLPFLSQLWQHSWGILWGPPGTGKTYTIGRQIGTVLHDGSERILVVSTTNRATDEVAIEIGKSAPDFAASGKILRIGKGSDYDLFGKEFTAMLKGTESEILRFIAKLEKKRKKTRDKDERARLRAEIKQLKDKLNDRGIEIFLDPDVKVVVSTAHRAMMLLANEAIRDILDENYAPFTTLIIDEAGLLSRTMAAGLSLLASRRVVLVGDPKQLAPISTISRVLPTNKARWLGRSGLSHLDGDHLSTSTYLLNEQHRMIKDIRKVVSAFQYDDLLRDGAQARQRRPVADFPSAIWYVLNEEGGDEVNTGAVRTQGGKGWTRPLGIDVVKKLLKISEIKEANGLFISPFVAQARIINEFFVESDINNWRASTVHSQQGTEADIVIFDTVNANSTGWPWNEWKRLINVGISRARRQLIILASREEMQQPFMYGLVEHLAAGIFVWQGGSYQFVPVDKTVKYKPPLLLLGESELLGNQIRLRKQMRPVLSHEQQRLINLKMDGKPRLVRGVAGSGKTVVLAHWLVQVVSQLKGDERIWIVYANNALKNLIESMISEAWQQRYPNRAFPLEKVELLHIWQVLKQMDNELGIIWNAGKPDYEYDEHASYILDNWELISSEPRCIAMFVDEAQDMGQSTLELLTLLVEQSDSHDPNSRAMHIFYDNAQNVYGRETPVWSELGLDMRGRSTIMKDSFRSTKQITEFAYNVYKKLDVVFDDDTEELYDLEAINENYFYDEGTNEEYEWWDIEFTRVGGPFPEISGHHGAGAIFDALAEQLQRWIYQEAVTPGDITLLYNDISYMEWSVKELHKRLSGQVKINLLRGEKLRKDTERVLATTVHSFKGYDSEIVVIAAADRFVSKQRGVLVNGLYTAMTRARSLLYIYYNQDVTIRNKRSIIDALEWAHMIQHTFLNDSPL